MQGSNFAVGIDLIDSFLCNIDLILTDSFSGSEYLTVDICQTDFIIVYKIKTSNAGAGESLNGISSDTAYTENGDP